MIKNVLQISPSFPPSTAYGGPSISVFLLSNSIANQNINLTVFTTTANGKTELPSIKTVPKRIESGVEVYYFPRVTKDHTHFSPSLLWKVWKEVKKFDIVHVHSWWNLVAILTVVIALIKGVKPILSMRGMMSEYTFNNTRTSKVKLFFHNIIGKKLLKKCIIHTTSKKEEKECKMMIGKFDGFILPNFISLPKVVKTQKENDVFRFCTICRIHPVKNLELVFNCLATLTLNWELDIVGSGEKNYEKDLKKLATNLNIHNRINWYGHLDGNDKYKILYNSDLYIQLSITENFGNSIIEAASVGIPVLVSETTGASEYITNIKGGWVVPLNKDLIILQINQAIDIIKANVFLSAAEGVEKLFSSKNLGLKYIETYKKLKRNILFES